MGHTGHSQKRWGKVRESLLGGTGLGRGEQQQLQERHEIPHVFCFSVSLREQKAKKITKPCTFQDIRYK